MHDTIASLPSGPRPSWAGRTLGPVWFCLALAAGATGCTPTVKVATDEPITINLNVNISHEIRIKVERELDTLFDENSDLF